MNYLASPPLVVAYALAGTMDIDIVDDPLGEDRDGSAGLPARHLALRARRSPTTVGEARARRTCSAAATARSSTATSAGARSRSPSGERFAWRRGLDLRAPAAVLRGHARASRAPVAGHRAARACSRVLGDSVTTDHISPAGSIKRDSPAGRYLQEHGVEPRDFNSYGSRRGNHEVMMRGTFANIRLRNLLGGPTRARCPRAASRATSPDGEPSRCRSTTPRCATRSEGVAAGRARRQGVRLGLLARLGREGHAAARRARRDRRELRAHPPLEPRRHGRAAAAVRRRARARPRSA